MSASKILIVEDEEIFAMNIEMQVELLGHEVVKVVDNSDDCLEIIHAEDIDLILMDINIKGNYDGVELAGLVKQKKRIPILFITSQEDDLSFNRAKRESPLGFLMKPFTDIQLKRSITLALDQVSCEKGNGKHDHAEIEIENQSFFIKKKNKLEKVNIDDIYYLESDGHYCKVYTSTEMYYIRKTMKEMISKLPSTKFVQCHRSYIVNVEKVKSVDLEDDCLIMEERKVPLSRREKDNILDRLNLL